MTRMKSNGVYTGVEEFAVPAQGKLWRDQIIALPALAQAGQEPVLVFTNLLPWAASPLAAICKDRWQVELFFKALEPTRKGNRSWAPAPVPSRRGSGGP